MNKPPTMNEPVRLERIEYPVPARLKRIRFMARLMDQSIRLPNGYRIGIDPLLGLIPGIGDLIAAILSFYIVYEAARLGIAKRILLRMSINVIIETVVGEIPILGDIFDAVWKANVRNLKLVELHHRPMEAERPLGKIFLAIATLFVGVIVISVAFAVAIIWFIISLFKS